MTIVPSTPQSHPLPKPGRKAQQDVERSVPPKKPKKVNSEIRKQQNRIASRNYREKRKQKLQYLQRLLRDHDSPDQRQREATPSETSQDGRGRSISAEYFAQRPVPNSEILPSNAHSPLLSSNSTAVANSVLVPTSTYDNSLLSTPQPFHDIQTTWSPPMYEPQPQVHISSWNLPHWMPSLDFAPHEDYRFTSPQTQPIYHQLPTPPQQPLEPFSNQAAFLLSSYSQCGTPSQTQRNTPVQAHRNCVSTHQRFDPHKRLVWI